MSSEGLTGKRLDPTLLAKFLARHSVDEPLWDMKMKKNVTENSGRTQRGVSLARWAEHTGLNLSNPPSRLKSWPMLSSTMFSHFGLVYKKSQKLCVASALRACLRPWRCR
jgi:hypothetical protein